MKMSTYFNSLVLGLVMSFVPAFAETGIFLQEAKNIALSGGLRERGIVADKIAVSGIRYFSLSNGAGNTYAHEIYRVSSDGSFLKISSVLTRLVSDGFPSTFSREVGAFTDVDGNGQLDYLYPARPVSGGLVYVIDALLNFDSSAPTVVENIFKVPNLSYGQLGNFFGTITWILSADFNKDGREDIVLGSGGGERGTLIYFNTPNGYVLQTLAIALDHFQFNLRDLRVADLNNDGLPDLIARDSAPDTTNQHEIKIFPNTGTSITKLLSFPTTWRTHFLIEDVDGNGLQDIILYDPLTNYFELYLNNGGFSFVKKSVNVSATGLIGLDDVQFVDLDGDGVKDLTFVGKRELFDNKTVELYFAKGMGSSEWNIAQASRITYIPLMEAYVTWIDINKDNKLDALVVGENALYGERAYTYLQYIQPNINAPLKADLSAAAELPSGKRSKGKIVISVRNQGNSDAVGNQLTLVTGVYYKKNKGVFTKSVTSRSTKALPSLSAGSSTSQIFNLRLTSKMRALLSKYPGKKSQIVITYTVTSSTQEVEALNNSGKFNYPKSKL